MGSCPSISSLVGNDDEVFFSDFWIFSNFGTSGTSISITADGWGGSISIDVNDF